MNDTVLISRTFAGLAATMLVAAFSLIVLAPPTMTLIQGLAELDPNLPRRLPRLAHHWIGTRVYTQGLLPLLVRPVWLVPTGLTLLFAGVAASTGSPRQSPRSTRTRG